MQKQYDFLFKILIAGSAGTGKSSLMLKFADESFTPSYISTIGVDFKIRTISIEDTLIKLQIWDTAGQQRFQTITRSYYKGARGIILVYDITDRQSFVELDTWLQQVRSHADDDVCLILVGMKFDCEQDRKVPVEEGMAYAAQHGMKFMQASAKDGTNVEQVFVALASAVKEVHLSKFQPQIKPQNAGPSEKGNNEEKSLLYMESKLRDLQISQNKAKNVEEKKVELKSEQKVKQFYDLLISSGISDVTVQILRSQQIRSLQELNYLKDEDLKTLGLKLGEIARLRKIK